MRARTYRVSVLVTVHDDEDELGLEEGPASTSNELLVAAIIKWRIENPVESTPARTAFRVSLSTAQAMTFSDESGLDGGEVHPRLLLEPKVEAAPAKTARVRARARR